MSLCVAVNVGGVKFMVSQLTLEKSPLLKEHLANAGGKGLFIDRNPAVFDHILDWMREGRLYIDRPDDNVYERLCADAEFYGLKSLRKFLKNRVNLCRYIYFQSPNGQVFQCYLDGFRRLKPGGGFVDEILTSEEWGRLIVNGDTILLNHDLSGIVNELLDPTTPGCGCIRGDPGTARFMLGARRVRIEGDLISYYPIPRDAHTKDISA